MNKFKMKVTAVIGVILLIGIYYYVTLPAINIHASEFWMYLVVLVILAAVVFIRKKNLNRYDWKESKGLKVILGILAVLVIAYVAGSVLSSPIVNAKKYQELLTVKNGEFTKDIEELSFDQIPLLDKDSAELLGDRKMGSMVDMVSQFEVDELYSQINYQDQPVRVSPLKYASVIKWFTNMREGIPAYIKIDMATQNTELVKLSEGMKYTTSDHFNRNIYRHLRFNYPTYIFNDLSFEIDEDGVPYWICPVKKYNIGLFGGTTIGRVVLCNAITGETKDYAVEDVPQWVDRVYSADLLVELYNYHGTLKHGFFNSVLGQKDCLNTTDGYNYLAIDDDVWVYTGVTSITGDQSNVGFVLMNQRTMETKFYEIEGATESSAMSSAEGQVQNLHYTATFPLLLNISGVQQRGKAVAEHVNTDQQRQDLQGSQCADADGRVLQNIEHDRKRQCLKARCKAEIRGSCGKDQHQQRPERQNARTAACRVHSHLGIDQLDIFLFLGLIGGNACRSCLLARDACLAACFLGSGFFHDLLLLGSLLGSFLFYQLGLAACLPLSDLLRGPALTLCHFLLARRDARFARFFNRLVFGGGGLCGLLCRFILLISG